MKKKMISLCMALAMIFSLLPAKVAFAATVDVWDGTTVATAYESGSGTENDPYQIATGAQLAYLASYRINNSPEMKSRT